MYGLNPGLLRTDLRAHRLGGITSWTVRVVETLIGLFTPSAETYAARNVPVLVAPELEAETGFHFNQQGRPLHPSAPMTAERVEAFTRATEALLARVIGAPRERPAAG